MFYVRSEEMFEERLDGVVARKGRVGSTWSWLWVNRFVGIVRTGNGGVAMFYGASRKKYPSKNRERR